MELPSRDAVAEDAIVPPGDYLIRVDEAKHWVSKKGNESLFIRGVVDQGDWKGAELVTWVSPAFRNGKALRQCVDTLLPDIPADQVKLDKATIDRMVGARAMVSVTHEPYEGEIKAKIDSGSFRPVEEQPQPRASTDVPAPVEDFTPEPVGLTVNGKTDSDEIPW